MKAVLLLCTLCALTITAYADLSPIVQGLVDTMLSYQDTTADPCEDFYQYACGNFIKENPVPANVTGPYIFMPAIQSIMQGNDALLAKIVTDDWPLIDDMYQACLNGQGPRQMQEFFLEQVTFVNSLNVSNPGIFWQTVVELVVHGVDAFMDPEAYVDENQEINLSLEPSGFGSSWSNDPSYIAQLNISIVAVFSTFESPASAVADSALVISIMQYIYANQNNGYGNVTIGQLNNQTQVSFDNLLNQLGMSVTDQDYITVYGLDYFEPLQSTLTTKFGNQGVQRYIQWRIWEALQTTNISACWTMPADQLPTSCQYVMSDCPIRAPWTPEEVCRYFVHSTLQDYVGLIFTYEIVNSDVVGSIHNMTTGIQTAFNASLPNLSWLDETSLEGVQYKLAHVLQIVGHPNILDKYAGLSTDPNQFYANMYNVQEILTVYNNQISTMVFNRSDFQFDTMIVNAFYSPQTNTINFPAGILESPMFSGFWPKLFQYARMGYVVGHENTHGFDNDGTLWNAFGLPGDIFDNSTRANFQKNAQCIADFYSEYEVYNNTYLNGTVTLGENIADIGGIKNTWRAYQAFVAQNGAEFADFELLSNLTTNQVFFLYFGQTWCTSENLAYLQFQLQVDVHSPSKFRINGPLTQFDEFATAFSCPANTTMNPASRCNLW